MVAIWPIALHFGVLHNGFAATYVAIHLVFEFSDKASLKAFGISVLASDCMLLNNSSRHRTVSCSLSYEHFASNLSFHLPSPRKVDCQTDTFVLFKPFHQQAYLDEWMQQRSHVIGMDGKYDKGGWVCARGLGASGEVLLDLGGVRTQTARS